MYVAGEPGNARDFLLNGIRDERARRSVIVELGRARRGEALGGRFDIVLQA
jgi:protocatechuate 3,4-dioxygenase beta subunit